MKQIALFLVSFACIAHNVSSQEIAIIDRSEKKFRKVGSKAPFYFVEDDLDTAILSYVARLKIQSQENPSLLVMYARLKSEARKLGANAFRIYRFDQSRIALTVDLYLAQGEAIERNNLLKTMNTVYVFAGDAYEKTSYFAFEFNGSVKTLRNGTFFKYHLREGEQVKLKKGTVTGTTMWIKWKPNQLPHYYSIHGFGKEAVVKRMTVSQASRPTRFITVEGGLGALLSNALVETSD